MNYKESQYDRVKVLMEQSNIFNGDRGNGIFRKKQYPFVLQDKNNNLYSSIQKDCLRYFKNNNIGWWGGELTPHTLSSQISCLNHLFAIRTDKEAVLKIVQQIEPKIVEVLEINTDIELPAYIQFEAVSDKDYLNEEVSTRGSHCTSIDALIYGLHEDNRKIIFPIEWKYTETYGRENKALGERGKVRQARYNELIKQSNQLKDNRYHVYYDEPFYQLMRQTLWAEQMIRHQDSETIKAEDYIHIHVVPVENKQLLEKEYVYCGENEGVLNGKKDMQTTWEDCLNNKEKYKLYSPERLLQPIVGLPQYELLIDYLRKRYW